MIGDPLGKFWVMVMLAVHFRENENRKDSQLTTSSMTNYLMRDWNGVGMSASCPEHYTVRTSYRTVGRFARMTSLDIWGNYTIRANLRIKGRICLERANQNI